jgi:hypothetical protein
MSVAVRRAGALATLFLPMLLGFPGGLRAQPAVPPPGPVTISPLGPPGTEPQTPPQVVPTPSPAPTPAPSTQPAAPPAAAAIPAGPAWLPRQSAELQILDKVDATHETRDVKVGGSVKVAELTISVEACLVRPPDRERDAAAYVDITDSNPAIQPFKGWLLAAEPAASVFEHPLYDVRVTGCD